MNILQYTLFKIGEQSFTLLSVFVFVFGVLITLIIAKLISRFLIKDFFPKHEVGTGTAKSLSRIVNYFIIVTGFLIALNSAGINISILFAGGAVVAVGIGFGLQNIVNNFVSGIIILIERPIKEGDVIEVGGRTGTVISISARSTRIKTPSEVMIIIPNSFFIEKEVVNKSCVTKTSFDITVILKHTEDVEKASGIMMQKADAEIHILREPKPTVSCTEITDAGIVLVLTVWVLNPDFQKEIKSNINYGILKDFKAEGIAFAVK